MTNKRRSVKACYYIPLTTRIIKSNFKLHIRTLSTKKRNQMFLFVYGRASVLATKGLRVRIRGTLTRISHTRDLVCDYRIDPPTSLFSSLAARLANCKNNVAYWIGDWVFHDLYWLWQSACRLFSTNTRPGRPGVLNSRAVIYRTAAHLRRDRRIGFLATGLFTEIPSMLRILNVTLHLIEETGASSLGDPANVKTHEHLAAETALSNMRLALIREAWEEGFDDWKSFQKLSYIFHHVDGVEINTAIYETVLGNYYSFTPAFPLTTKHQWSRFGAWGVLDFFRSTPMSSRRALKTKSRSLVLEKLFVGNIRTFWLPTYKELSFKSFIYSFWDVGLRRQLLHDSFIDWGLNPVVRVLIWAGDRVRNDHEMWIAKLYNELYVPTAPAPRFAILGILQRARVRTKFSWRAPKSFYRTIFRRRQWYSKFRYDRNWRHHWAPRRPRHMYIALRMKSKRPANVAKLEYTAHTRLFTFLWRRQHWRASRYFLGKYRFHWVAKPRRRKQRQLTNAFYTLFDQPGKNPNIIFWACGPGMVTSETLHCIAGDPIRHWKARKILAYQQFKWDRQFCPDRSAILPIAPTSVLRWFKTRYRFFGISGYSRFVEISAPAPVSMQLQALRYGAIAFSTVGTLSSALFTSLWGSRSHHERLAKFTRRASPEWRWYSTIRLRRILCVVGEFFKAPYYSLRRFRQRHRKGRSSIQHSKYGRTNTLNMSNKFASVSYTYAWHRPRNPRLKDSQRVEEHIWGMFPWRYTVARRRLRKRKRFFTAANFYFGGRWLRWQLAGSKGARLWRRRSGVQNLGFRAYRHSRNWNFALAFWAFSNGRIRRTRMPLWSGYTAVSNFDKFRSFLSISHFKPLLRFRQRYEWGFSGFQTKPSPLKNKPYRQRNAAMGIFKIPGQNILIMRTKYSSGLKRTQKFRFLETSPIGRFRTKK